MCVCVCRCGNVNWARRSECNVCRTAKFNITEARTGMGIYTHTCIHTHTLLCCIYIACISHATNMYIILYIHIYSLVPGVYFDLFDSLYKPDAPKTTTVHVSDTRTDMLHCTATRWGLWLKHLAPGYKPIITRTPLSCSGGIRALCPRASCTYTSQSTQWGVITNTYIHI